MYIYIYICAMVKSRYVGDGHPTFNRNRYNGYINPYYWVDDHPLLYGNNGSLDPGTCIHLNTLELHLYSISQGSLHQSRACGEVYCHRADEGDSESE